MKTPVFEATELYGMFLGHMSFGAESLPKWKKAWTLAIYSKSAR
jgi:hypothetical protein